MLGNPVFHYERIYIQDEDLSYNFTNCRNLEKEGSSDGIVGSGKRYWHSINKMFRQITSFILAYFIHPLFRIEESQEAESERAFVDEKEQSDVDNDSDIEILGEKIASHPITNDYHLINQQRPYQNNSILENSFGDHVGNSTKTSSPHNSSSSISNKNKNNHKNKNKNNYYDASQALRNLALKGLKAGREQNKSQNEPPPYGTDLSISQTHFSNRQQWQLTSTPRKTQPASTVIQRNSSHRQLFNIDPPKTEYQQSILNFYIPPKPVSITSYSLVDDLIANFKNTDRISETYKIAQSKTLDVITAKRLASKVKKIEPLTDSQLTKVNQAWQSGSRSICITRYNIDLTFADLQTLKDGRWLNDNVIDFYLNMVMKQNPKKIFIWTTHFYSTLASRGYNGVARWAKRKKIDLFTMDRVIVPINISNTHWALAVIDNVAKTITYYDSLTFGQSGNPEAVENLQMYMDHEAQRLNCDAVQYKLIPYIEAPQQQNGSDCGVFTCIAARYLAQGEKFNYSQNDMKMIRRRMTYEIMNDELLK
ncbi:hypothetical protein KGF57_005226 [Candida theae]|uniref:Ubiquitin-like protease family profile domain-containing protein n=1 Tax=Candida theae TaxID=1198502 RepID=A0AAD5B9G0_9ASCO|nr:uncharacterized protein KGF57_005226 [Candida theae]KAI5948828.1 hypothetical protein KGF57_005226 [Candida theae]